MVYVDPSGMEASEVFSGFSGSVMPGYQSGQPNASGLLDSLVSSTISSWTASPGTVNLNWVGPGPLAMSQYRKVEAWGREMMRTQPPSEWANQANARIEHYQSQGTPLLSEVSSGLTQWIGAEAGQRSLQMEMDYYASQIPHAMAAIQDSHERAAIADWKARNAAFEARVIGGLEVAGSIGELLAAAAVFTVGAGTEGASLGTSSAVSIPAMIGAGVLATSSLDHYTSGWQALRSGQPSRTLIAAFWGHGNFSTPM